MSKKTFKLRVIISLIALVLPLAPSLAVGTSSIPECQFTGQPTAEQLAACQAAAQAQNQGQTTNPTTPPANIPTNIPASPTNIPSGPPSGAGQAGFDFNSYVGQLPKPPAMAEGGMPPTFMGVDLNGSGGGGAGAAAQGMAQAAGQIGAALEQIRDGLLKAEDGAAQMKSAKINVGDLDSTLKNARSYFDQAQDAFATADYQKAAEYLQKFSSIDLLAKFAQAEDNMVSGGLIGNVRKQMETALQNMGKMKNSDSETDEMKANLMASLEKVKLADEALKKGDKKTAASIMKELRDSAPQDAAQGEMGNFKGMSKKMMGKILNSINEGLTRAGKGMNKAKASGLEVSAESLALLEKAKAVYLEAQTAYDKEDYAGAAAKLGELQDLNLEEKFGAFKKAMLPPDRMNELAGQAANGIKALDLTIQHSKEAGYDTAELEQLLEKVKNIVGNAQAAAKSKDVETFLTNMDQLDALNIAEQVDGIIRKLANAEIKDLVAAGLEKLNNVISALDEAIGKLAAKKIDTTNAKSVLDALKTAIAAAQAKYDAGDYMSAGKLLDQAMNDMISLVNIVRDSGVALSGERMKQINDIINLGSKTDAGQMVVSPDKVGQLDSIFSTVGNDEAMDMKQAFMQFDPELTDKVIAQRQKDKKYMDAILKDVLPLIPAADREKILEGKTGLLEEMAATDKSINNIKRIKGITADTTKTLSQVKDQIKAYNFDPDIAGVLDQKMADFNDKIQSGEIKDPKVIGNYIKVLQEETAKAIKESMAKKLKAGILPAKNIDDNNPYFDEIKKLKDDGAIKSDKQGNIDLNKKLTGKEVADMINKTLDANTVKNAPPAITTVSDAGNMVFNAYGIKPNIDPKNPEQMAKFLQNIGANIKPSDIKGKITLGEAADIIAAADNRWGKADK